MVGNAADAIAFAFRMACNRSQIGVEFTPHRIIENRFSIFCAENHMDQNKRERLWHRVDYRSGFQPSCLTDNATWGFTPCWYKGAPLALSLAAAVSLAFWSLFPPIASAQSPPLRIKIINAKTNQPIPNERLNVSLRADHIG